MHLPSKAELFVLRVKVFRTIRDTAFDLAAMGAPVVFIKVLSIGAAYKRHRDALGGLWDLGMVLLCITLCVLALVLDHKTKCGINALSPGSPLGAVIYHHLSKQTCGAQ